MGVVTNAASLEKAFSYQGLNLGSLLRGAVETENGVTPGCTLPSVYPRVTR